MHARLLLAIGLFVGCNTDSTNLEQSRLVPKRTSELAQSEPKPKAAAPIKKIDLSLGDGLEMRRPIVSGRVSVIPIITTKLTTAQRFVTLQDSMAKRLVTVREISTGYDGFVVDTVSVHNKASEPLAIIAGELILDAHQDRVTAENTVVAAGETRNVKVRCVEKERDHGGSYFTPGKALAELSLRRVVVTSHQDHVWHRVDQINYRDKTSNDTRSYRFAAKLLGTGTASERRDEMVKKLEAIEERQQIVGVVVAIDNVPIALERFATPELYREFEPRLIASYMPETAGPARDGKLAPEQIRALAREPGHTTAATHSVFVRL
jgi:hypothetical protein